MFHDLSAPSAQVHRVHICRVDNFSFEIKGDQKISFYVDSAQ